MNVCRLGRGSNALLRQASISSNSLFVTPGLIVPIFTRGYLKSSTNPICRVTSLSNCKFFTVQSKSFSSDSPLEKEKIDKLVKSNKIVVFMKGVPDEPKCGFSNAVVQILRMHGISNYDAHNVLADENIRQGIKDYTNWPTIPQIFINGEFVGGCDILIEMHKNGELVEQLSKIGIKSALLDQKEVGKDGSGNK